MNRFNFTLITSFILAVFAFANTAFGVEDYREITLVDGRVFVGEVTATEAGGLRTKLPQGTLLVPYHQLQDMLPADSAKFMRQQNWLIYVIGDNKAKSALRQAISQIPAVDMYGNTGTEGALNSLHLNAARQCKGDLACTSEALDPGYWLWVVSVSSDDSSVLLRGTLNTNESVYEIEMDSMSIDGLVPAMYEMLGIDKLDEQAATVAASPARPEKNKTKEKVAKAPKVPKAKVAKAPKTKVAKAPKEPTPAKQPAEKVAKEPKTPKEPKVKVAKAPKNGPASDAKLFGMSFVPLPGYPSLAQGDTAGFAMSLAVVIPATAGWIGATGKNAQSVPEHAAMSIGGFYVATVAINQLFGKRSRNRAAKIAVGVSPATKSGDGTMVQLAMPLK